MMRSVHALPCLPLLLFLTPGCTGRYLLGNEHQDSSAGASSINGDAGAGGSFAGSAGDGAALSGSAGALAGSASVSGSAGNTNGGSSTSGGTSGSAGDANGGRTSGGTGGGAGAGPVTHGRWLASETFVSSSSTQTELSLVDLSDPNADPIVLDSTAGSINAFSNDGRWLLYNHFRGNQLTELYLVDLTGDLPLEPQLVLTTGSSMPCRWAQDSSRVACIEDPSSTDAIGNVVAFDTSGATPGPRVLIGSVLPQSAEAPTGGERELAFLDKDNLVYSYGANDFARVTWKDQTPSAPTQLGLGGGTIVQQSPDGRLVVKRINPNYPLGTVLVDVRLGQATVLDSSSALGVSGDFEAGYGIRAPAAGESGSGTYLYDWVSGTQLTEVGQEPVVPGRGTFTFAGTFVGHTLVRTKGDQVVVVDISASGFTEQVVPGAYSSVNDLELDPTGTWLYIGTSELDAQQHPIVSSIDHWLSHITASGPSEAQSVAQGYAAGRVTFSPNGHWLMLSGYDSTLTTVGTFQLFDLADPAQIKTYTIDLPFSWADVGWSDDSRYLSFIGGEIEGQSRPLYVVDASAPTQAPRLITTCGSGSLSPTPACPALAAFQP
jgi:hypothetical protein